MDDGLDRYFRGNPAFGPKKPDISTIILLSIVGLAIAAAIVAFSSVMWQMTHVGG